MKVRRRAAGVAVVAVVAGDGMTLRAGRAQAATSYWFVCDTSSQFERCAQLDNNTYSAGDPIILNDPASTGDGNLSYAWYRQKLDVVSAGAGFPFTGHAASLNTTYNGDAVVQIFKHTSSGHDGCMGIDSNALAQVGWEACGSSTLGIPNTTVWIFHVPDSKKPISDTSSMSGGRSILAMATGQRQKRSCLSAIPALASVTTILA